MFCSECTGDWVRYLALLLSPSQETLGYRLPGVRIGLPYTGALSCQQAEILDDSCANRNVLGKIFMMVL